jgi:hypothetical protein
LCGKWSRPLGSRRRSSGEAALRRRHVAAAEAPPGILRRGSRCSGGVPTPGLISAHSSLDCTPPGEPCAATPLSVSDMPGLGFLLPPLLPSSPPLSHSTLPCKNLQSRALEKGIHRSVPTSHIFPQAHFPPTLSPLPPPSPSTTPLHSSWVSNAPYSMSPQDACWHAHLPFGPKRARGLLPWDQPWCCSAPFSPANQVPCVGRVRKGGESALAPESDSSERPATPRNWLTREIGAWGELGVRLCKPRDSLVVYCLLC